MQRSWQLSLSERVNAARDMPLYMQVIQAVIRDIRTGRLAPGAYMPSSRELAAILGINRKTVVLAYEDLIAQGWLVSTSTRGTMVSTSLPEAPRGTDQPGIAPDALRVGYRFFTPPERSLAIADGDGPKLDEGAPDGRLLPPELLARAYKLAAHRASRGNGLLYRNPLGAPALRENIAEMLRTQRGLQVTAENICITRGSQNSIFLASMILIQPGDAVIVEKLTYEPALAAFQARGARIIPVDLDGDGIDVDDVERVCRAHPVRAIFLTPHHQFPTTVPLRPERRLRILELARQFGFAIIEDDYDHEFHFESQPLLPMAAYAPHHVIYAGSLSKLLLPALRIGYIAAPVSVIAALAHMVSLSDGMGNRLTEEAAAELIDSGELRRHARKVRQVYARRRTAFAESLRATLGELAEFEVPEGGLAFWLRLRTDIERLEARARAAGLRFASSRSFAASDDAPSGLRIGFASLDEGEARAVLEQLAAAAR